MVFSFEQPCIIIPIVKHYFKCFCFPVRPWVKRFPPPRGPCTHCLVAPSSSPGKFTGLCCDPPWAELLFSIRLFTALSGCQSCSVTEKRTQSRVSQRFYSPFTILDWCQRRCVPAVLPTPPKRREAGSAWAWQMRAGERSAVSCGSESCWKTPLEHLAAETAAGWEENGHWIWHHLIKRVPQLVFPLLALLLYIAAVGAG